MTVPRLKCMLIDDDSEYLELLTEEISSIVEMRNDVAIDIHPYKEFFAAKKALECDPYFDLIVTDIFVGGKYGKGDQKGLEIIEIIKESTPCPIIAISSKVSETDLPERTTPFFKIVDKTDDDASKTAFIEVLDTGIPQAFRRSYARIVKDGREYIWDFLNDNWDRVNGSVNGNSDVLSRLIDKRLGLLFGRMPAGVVAEHAEVHGAELYIYPPISEGVHRMGEILQHKSSGEWRVILTPHCHLQPQDGAPPRAEYVLTAKTVPMVDKIKDVANDNTVRDRICFPAKSINPKPAGRFFPIPPFIDIPGVYVDLMQIESIRLEDVNDQYRAYATLDTPFAEKLQECFKTMYGSIGLPSLSLESVRCFRRK